ncbi:SDR family oxidoreductase [candidate division KSB1 bacterium]|nr:SDR family oxidoreductase [candidate division KSB1 bacterium]
MKEQILNSTAIVTGGAKRIGRSIALALARDGYNIIIHYNRSLKEAKQVEQMITKLGRECHLISCDFNNMKQVSLFIHRAFEFFPDCDVLINNASIFQRARLMTTDEEMLDRHLNINFKTPLLLTQEFAQCTSKGHIINILDTKISRTLIEYFAYTLSKKALAEFTKMAAKELAPNFRVNGVCPGLILPPPGKDDEYLERLSQNIPLERRGTPDHVVDAVRFLLNNPYITGQSIFVDGGENLK